jgi:hypothetical protein
MNDEFIGMADYFMESIHDPLTSDSESISSSISSQGSYHPSRECFIVDIADGAHHEATPEGHVTNVNDGAPHEGNETTTHPANGRGAVADVEFLAHPHVH